MARKRNPAPAYIFHAKSGRGRLQWYDATGVRREKLLPGPFGSPQSLAAKARVELEILTAPTAAPATSPNPHGIGVAELLLAFLDHAEQHYRRADGSTTHELDEFKLVMRYVRELYGETPVAQFGPVALKTLRQKFVAVGWCRTLINRRIGRVRLMFKWGASEELVPVAVPLALATVTGFQRGRSGVRESAPVKPVDDATVDATLPHLGVYLRTMIELQRLTGMRPGEVCALSLSDIDRTGETWVYRPGQHKTAHRGKVRMIPFGPRARAVLVAFLNRTGAPDGCAVDPDAPLFSPAEAREERFRAARKNRKSKVPPSQLNRRKAKPVRAPGTAYSAEAFGYAIRKAAAKAGVPNWHPNQLRHSFGTKVRKAHGLEAAQVLLGHAKADVTQVYAERDAALAAEVAAQIG